MSLRGATCSSILKAMSWSRRSYEIRRGYGYGSVSVDQILKVRETSSFSFPARGQAKQRCNFHFQDGEFASLRAIGLRVLVRVTVHLTINSCVRTCNRSNRRNAINMRVLYYTSRRNTKSIRAKRFVVVVVVVPCDSGLCRRNGFC